MMAPMAKLKYADNLITLRCSVCKRRNYYTHKNKKQVERKIELKKFCPWDRKQTVHKEARISGK
jgi:large subunit ribosomal protein L33